jgi:hypothetical protein
VQKECGRTPTDLHQATETSRANRWPSMADMKQKECVRTLPVNQDFFFNFLIYFFQFCDVAELAIIHKMV